MLHLDQNQNTKELDPGSAAIPHNLVNAAICLSLVRGAVTATLCRLGRVRARAYVCLRSCAAKHGGVWQDM